MLGQQQEHDNEPAELSNLSNLYSFDTIVAIVFGLDDTSIITKSDIERLGLDGAQRSLDDIILETLIYQDAKKYKLLPDEDMVDKHLKAVQQANNLSFEGLKEIFKSAGYSWEEGRRQFGIMTAVASMIDFKIRSRLIVPEREVKAYYDAHPQVEEASYYIMRAFVPFSSTKRNDLLRKELEIFAETGNGMFSIEWGDPFWIKKSDIAEQKRFIESMDRNEIVIREEAHGFELLKLIDKREERLVPLEERYREIADTLRRPKYEELFNAYKTELLSSATVIYF